MGDKRDNNIDSFVCDVDHLLKKETKKPKLDDEIPTDIPLDQQWDLHQIKGKEQIATGQTLPPRKHRCDDHLEDILVSFAQKGERHQIIPSIIKYLQCTLSNEGNEPERVRDIDYYSYQSPTKKDKIL